MSIILMLGWWYSQGWLWVLQGTQNQLTKVSRTFAVSVLIRTLFSPWKQIYTKSTFRTFLRDAVDNAVSRTIGTVVRATILIWAGILSSFIVIGGLVSILLWPFIPLLVIILPVLALSGATI